MASHTAFGLARVTISFEMEAIVGHLDPAGRSTKDSGFAIG
jgi:hypothetical protein